MSGRDYVREKVRIRDKHTCQKCKRKWLDGERRFDVHHIDGMCGKKSRGYDRVSDMQGLITLCHSCHLSKHVDKIKFRVYLNSPLKNQTERIQYLIKCGLSRDEIGRVYGVSSAAISKHLKLKT